MTDPLRTAAERAGDRIDGDTPGSRPGSRGIQALEPPEEVLVRYRLLFDHAPYGIVVIDPVSSRFVDFNETACRQLGYSREEFAGLSVPDIEIAETPPEVRRRIDDVKRGGAQDFETTHRTREGEIRHVRVTAQGVEIAGRVVHHCVWQDITVRKLAEEAVRASEKKFSKLFNLSPTSISVIRLNDGCHLAVNYAFQRMWGYSPEEVVGRSVDDLGISLYPDYLAYIGHLLKARGSIQDMEINLCTKTGEERIALVSAELIEMDGATCCLSVAMDVTERAQAEMKLKESEERYRIAIEHSGDGVAIERDGTHLYVNRRFLDMFGYESLDDFRREGQHSEVHPDDREKVMEFARQRQCGEPSPSRYEYKGIRKDGTVIYIEAAVASTVHDGQPASLAYLRDVTERKRMEDRLEAMSTVDELTGLYNRRGFLALSQEQLNLAEQNGGGMEVFFIDLDGMKQINDTLGHREGDQALVDVGAVLRQTFRKSDIIGRMGGDEFAVLAVNTAGEMGEDLTKRLRRVLDAHNKSDTRRYHLSLSVGMAHFDPRDPEPLEDLIVRADNLMYREKKAKKKR